MTEKGIHDLAVDELHRRRGLVREELQRRSKGKRPFRMDPVDNDTLMYIHDNMSSAALGDLPDPNNPDYIGDFEYAVETYGYEAVDNWLFEMSQLKKRRGL